MSTFGNTAIGRTVAGAMLFAAVAMAGCGSDPDIATGSDAASTPSFEDAMVNYSSCMREHGVDMPDPQFSDDGSGGGGGAMTLAIPLGSSDAGAGGGPGLSVGGPGNEAFKAAAEACQPIMDEATQNMPKPSAEEQAKMRDDALEFAQCMRDHGVDMPDPTFDGGSGGPMIIQGSSTDRAPLDTDKFNEASSACSAEGLGGGFTVSSADGATGGNGVSVRSGSSK
jgi:hypothetical protein